LGGAIDSGLGGINFFHFFIGLLFVLAEKGNTAASAEQQGKQDDGSKAQTAREPQRRSKLEQGEASFSAVCDDNCRC
jgi:hypothetical protein